MAAVGTGGLRVKRRKPFHNTRLTKETSAVSKKRAVMLNPIYMT
jgi:hypothetical protein